MLKDKIIGEIIVPFGALPQKHELITAQVLIQTGRSVEFIPISIQATPDIKFINHLWEIKSPIGKSSRTIENSLRSALRQSENVIIDLHRIHLPESKCITYLKNHTGNFHGLKRLLIITKSNTIYQILPKRACIPEISVLK